MSEVGEKKRLVDKLQDNYRLVIIDDDDLREVSTFKFNLLSLYILLSTMIVLIGALTISLIVFTPVKKMVPGYGDINNNAEYIELKRKVDNLEEIVESQEVYNKGLLNMLNGMSPDDTADSKESENDKSKNNEAKDRLVTSVKKLDIEDAKKSNELAQLIFATPITGKISAAFDPETEHYGIDIVAPKNTPVKAVLGGIVISADWTLNDGNTVTIQHSRNVISVYKHNSSLLVKNGEIVKTGQAIAIIGNTGKLSTGPHAHIEIWYNGSPVNPASFISFN
jgi:murein DD-endopeptidase MepM/ murein hydrolase activator NlpD